MNVVVLRKCLLVEPQPMQIPGVRALPMRLPEDAGDWLALRDLAFAGQLPSVGTWTLEDVNRELCEGCSDTMRRPTWLARSANARSRGPIGAISLSPPAVKRKSAGVHWLMVDPNHRRQGIGSLLLNEAERYCWERDWRELRLETHGGWRAALAFYKKHGFQ
jgi:GNAT superfamily N-acetyltransferase